MRMKFLDLSLKHRYDIYSRTKKVLRKYQKGIISGKLTADKFADNMLKDISMIAYLDEIGITVTDSGMHIRSMYKPLYLYKMTA